MRRAVAALSAWLLIILMVVPRAAAEGEEPAGSESTAGQLQQTQAGNTEDSLPYRTYIKRYTDSPAGTGTAETPASQMCIRDRNNTIHGASCNYRAKQDIG